MMKIKIQYKTGQYQMLDAIDYSPGEFRAWVSRNLMNSKGCVTGYVTFNDCFVNVNEILYVAEIKEEEN